MGLPGRRDASAHPRSTASTRNALHSLATILPVAVTNVGGSWAREPDVLASSLLAVSRGAAVSAGASAAAVAEADRMPELSAASTPRRLLGPGLGRG